MYKNELDKHIQSGKISNSFVLFGESSFLIDSYTKKLSDVEDASALIFTTMNMTLKVQKLISRKLLYLAGLMF